MKNLKSILHKTFFCHILNCYKLCIIPGLKKSNIYILYFSIFLYCLTAACDIFISLIFSSSNNFSEINNIVIILILYLIRSALYSAAPIVAYYLSFRLLSQLRKEIITNVIRTSIPLDTEIKTIFLTKLQDLSDKYIINSIKITGEIISVLCYSSVILIYIFTNNIFLESLLPLISISLLLLLISRYLKIQGHKVDIETSKIVRTSFLLSTISRTFTKKFKISNKNPFDSIKLFSKYLSRYYSASTISRVLIEFISVVFVAFLLLDGSLELSDLIAILYAGSRLLLSLVTFSSTYASTEYGKPLYDSIIKTMYKFFNNNAKKYYPLTAASKNIFRDFEIRIKEYLYSDLKENKLLIIKGESGAGKSTLLANIYAILNSYGINAIYINPDRLSVDIKIKDFLNLYNLSIKKINNFLKINTIPKSLKDLFDVIDENKNLDTLSLGESQRLQILIPIIQKPELIIIDESLSGISPTQELEIIRYLNKNKFLIVMTSHRSKYLLKENKSLFEEWEI